MRTIMPALTLSVLATLCGLGIAVAAADPPAPPPTPAQQAPVEPGLALIQTHCIDCHDTGFIFQTRRPAQDWGDIVNEMVSRGADLDEAEIALVRAYLEKNWSLPPPAPPP
jgi:mono/diheme cytochrome c family protein